MMGFVCEIFLEFLQSREVSLGVCFRDFRVQWPVEHCIQLQILLILCSVLKYVMCLGDLKCHCHLYQRRCSRV